MLTLEPLKPIGRLQNEVARRIRALPETAGVRLVAMTGYGKESDKKRAQSAGFDKHLTKPVESKVLLAELG